MSPSVEILLLCDDLIFSSRIAGTARAAGLGLRSYQTSAELLAAAKKTPPHCVLLDLHVAGLDIAAAVGELAMFSPRPKVIGYGSHVDVETLKAARAAGCDVVLPRSKFVADLETALPQWATRE